MDPYEAAIDPAAAAPSPHASIVGGEAGACSQGSLRRYLLEGRQGLGGQGLAWHPALRAERFGPRQGPAMCPLAQTRRSARGSACPRVERSGDGKARETKETAKEVGTRPGVQARPVKIAPLNEEGTCGDGAGAGAGAGLAAASRSSAACRRLPTSTSHRRRCRASQPRTTCGQCELWHPRWTLRQINLY